VHGAMNIFGEAIGGNAAADLILNSFLTGGVH
jgi:hypothetical protein